MSTVATTNDLETVKAMLCNALTACHSDPDEHTLVNRGQNVTLEADGSLMVIGGDYRQQGQEIDFYDRTFDANKLAQTVLDHFAAQNAALEAEHMRDKVHREQTGEYLKPIPGLVRVKYDPTAVSADLRQKWTNDPSVRDGSPEKPFIELWAGSPNDIPLDRLCDQSWIFENENHLSFAPELEEELAAAKAPREPSWEDCRRWLTSFVHRLNEKTSDGWRAAIEDAAAHDLVRFIKGEKSPPTLDEIMARYAPEPASAPESPLETVVFQDVHVDAEGNAWTEDHVYSAPKGYGLKAMANATSDRGGE